jgi:hypothetical protein
MALVKNRYTGQVVESALPIPEALAEAAMQEDGLLDTARWGGYYKALITRQGTVFKLGQWESVNE